MTIAVQLLEFPFTSVAVSITVFVPTSEQSKVVVFKLREAIPQASVVPLSISEVVIVPLPAPSKITVTSWHITLGGVLSTTVTIAVHVAVAPAAFATVKVTVLGPISLQSKLVVSMVNVAAPHETPLPPSIKLGVNVAIPVTSSGKVISVQTAVGGLSSTTVTMAVSLLEFPEPSVTVIVTKTGLPVSEQSKLLGLTVIEAIPQLSAELLSTSPPTIVASPVAFRNTVMSIAFATGGVVSTMVTSAKQLALFPLLSVTVKVTELAPRSLQVKLLTLSVLEAIPQASVLPLSI